MKLWIQIAICFIIEVILFFPLNSIIKNTSLNPAFDPGILGYSIIFVFLVNLFILAKKIGDKIFLMKE